MCRFVDYNYRYSTKTSGLKGVKCGTYSTRETFILVSFYIKISTIALVPNRKIIFSVRFMKNRPLIDQIEPAVGLNGEDV